MHKWHFVQAHAWFVITGIAKQWKPLHTAVVGRGQHSGQGLRLLAHTHQLGLLLCLLRCFLCFLLLFLQGFLGLGLLLLLAGSKTGRHHTTKTALWNFHLPFFKFPSGKLFWKMGKSIPTSAYTHRHSTPLAFKLLCLSSIVSTCPKKQQRLN